MTENPLAHVFIFLASAAFIVPLASRFKLGSVIGYLLVGIGIGPFGFSLIGNANQIMQFSEFGIVMMLFLIGLELEPDMLWRLRKTIVGLGGLQVILTTALLFFLGMLLGYPWKHSIAISMGLSLSSTALVLQLLEEKKLLQTAEGETSFSVLLFQDIAVIGILIILPLLADTNTAASASHTPIPQNLPEWLRATILIGVIAVIMLGGHFLAHHLFYAVAKTNLREIFTATSLALVVGVTLLMQLIGAPPALGAFIAGVVLANSEYKRTLETDIEPFKGLLLGLFFISIGMGMNFDILIEHPIKVIAVVFSIILIKSLILILLGRRFGLTKIQTFGFALALSQVGEFAFVLLQFCKNELVVPAKTADFFTFVVALSMGMTPLLILIYYRFIVPRYMSQLKVKSFDKIDKKNSIILAGYGRFGQIIARFLSHQGLSLTILDIDPEQIELLRKFGQKGYFGDASRLDLLRAAGAKRAKLLIVAVDNPDTALKIVSLAKTHFPKIKIFARARNRRHAYELHRAGVNYFRRETFDSALAMARDIMISLGSTKESVMRKARLFRTLDEASLEASFSFFEKENELINFTRQIDGELERILQAERALEAKKRH